MNTTREAVFLGTYFYTYEGLRDFLKNMVTRGQQKDNIPTAWTVPVAGGLSGAWSWFVSFPLDCIKAGIQGQNLSERSASGEMIAKKKLSSIDVLKDLLETKGWRGLCKSHFINSFFLPASSFLSI